MWKFSYSFCIMTIFYFINWIVAAETIQGGKLFKGGNYSWKILYTIRSKVLDPQETKLSSKCLVRFKVIWSRPDYFCFGPNLFCTGLWTKKTLFEYNFQIKLSILFHCVHVWKPRISIYILLTSTDYFGSAKIFFGPSDYKKPSVVYHQQFPNVILNFGSMCTYMGAQNFNLYSVDRRSLELSTRFPPKAQLLLSSTLLKKNPEMSRQYAFLRDRPSTFPIFYTKIEFFSYIFIEY